MSIHRLTDQLSVSSQIAATEMAALKEAGFRSIICCRPDGEAADQPSFREIEQSALAAGLAARYCPVVSGRIEAPQATTFNRLFDELPKPVLAYCRSGTRVVELWALAMQGALPQAEIAAIAAQTGLKANIAPRAHDSNHMPPASTAAEHEVVIVGGGAAGIATAASLLARQPGLDIAIIDPADMHYYQPGFTMVGGGVFNAEQTARTMAAVMPQGVRWLRERVAAFEPERNAVILDNGRSIKYKQLVVCPGLKLNWDAVEGLSETLGRNGVTSNYQFQTAPYTWELVRSLRSGRAIFTQPPMPIKCAGAPQKAMYLAADHWKKTGVLQHIDIDFCNAGGVLFGVAHYVPALMQYIEAYGVNLNYNHNLVAVDGGAKKATFIRTGADGAKETVIKEFDMLHVTPPQTAPDFIRSSPLADAAGWVDIDPATMRHKVFANVSALGDVGNTSNAKTAAAVRKQAPVVAHNVLIALGKNKGAPLAHYDGYGSCPLTVERGKIVLAEFLYGGKVAPTFPSWLIDGAKPSPLAWQLKERVLPMLYWHAMLKGREWLAQPELAK